MTETAVERVIPDNQVGAVANLPRDLAIVKMDGDSIMALAAAHPRNYATILADIQQQLETFKSFATSAMYAKPVGREGGRDGPMKYARGLSIRAAESIAEAYGYNKCRIDVTPTPAGARVVGTFVDYQKGRVFEVASTASRRYKDRFGNMKEHPEDRFFSVVCQAIGSKCLREAILRAVPAGLKLELEAIVNDQLDEFLDENTVKKLVAEFSTKGVTQEMLESLIGKRVDSFSKADRQTLVGTWNAIDQGETTVQELFGNGAADQKPPEDAATVGKKLAERVKKLTPKAKPEPDDRLKTRGEMAMDHTPPEPEQPPSVPEKAPEPPPTDTKGEENPNLNDKRSEALMQLTSVLALGSERLDSVFGALNHDRVLKPGWVAWLKNIKTAKRLQVIIEACEAETKGATE